jgi:hypothetical protein
MKVFERKMKSVNSFYRTQKRQMKSSSTQLNREIFVLDCVSPLQVWGYLTQNNHRLLPTFFSIPYSLIILSFRDIEYKMLTAAQTKPRTNIFVHCRKGLIIIFMIQLKSQFPLGFIKQHAMMIRH